MSDLVDQDLKNLEADLRRVLEIGEILAAVLTEEEIIFIKQIKGNEILGDQHQNKISNFGKR